MNRLTIISLVCLLFTSVLGGIAKAPNPITSRAHLHPDLPPSTTQNYEKYEQESSYWMEQAKQFVAKQVTRRQNTNIAKNVIFFIGDGMSLATLSATRMYLGGEDRSLSFEEFPYVGLAKTYCVDQLVPDSASTATAYLSGVKTNAYLIGVDASVYLDDCVVTEAQRVKSIARWAMDAGKSAGLVTTTKVTHASPSGVYGSVTNRFFENDKKVRVSCDPDLVDDLAEQLVHGDVGRDLSVILGGGRQEFRDDTLADEELGIGNNKRGDGKDLIQEWLALGDDREYVWNRTALMMVNTKTVGKLLGLFEPEDLPYNINNIEDPSLTELTEKAIEVLSQNENGYFLFVEAGKIDHGHHFNMGKVALEDTAELSRAVAMARAKTKTSDTLIVVSSDHSHTMTYSGYGERGADILGMAGISDVDHLPYTTLSYANGPGYYDHVNPAGGRVNPNNVDMESDEAVFPGMTPMQYETHAGDDVGIFASGPWEHLFGKTMEQNALPHLMAYALCVGNGKTACSP